MAIHTSTSTVFNIPELAEAILSHLSLHDLLTMDNINHSFHNLISSSPALQRILTLETELSAATNSPEAIQAALDRLSITHDHILDFYPFTFSGCELIETTAPSGTERSLKLLYAICPDQISVSNVQRQIWAEYQCLRSQARLVGSSWKEIKVARMPLDVDIAVYHSSLGSFETLKYCLGEAKRGLGDVAECLEEALAVVIEMER